MASQAAPGGGGGGGANAAAVPASAAAPAKICAACGAPGARSLCMRCREARYCSAACQRADWPAHKPRCAEPPLPPLPPGVLAAVQRLDAAALAAALQPLPAAASPLARHASLTAAAVAAFGAKAQAGARIVEREMGGRFQAPPPGEKTDYSVAANWARVHEGKALVPVLRLLLAHGAPPRGTLPRARPEDCSAPIEVLLARLHCSTALALLAGAGSRLDGVCTGAAEGVCQSECSALRERMASGVTLLHSLGKPGSSIAALPQADLAAMAEDLLSPADLRALLAAGAGGARLSHMWGQRLAPEHRYTAVAAALVDAVSLLNMDCALSCRAVTALLEAGASPDVTLYVPRGPGVPLQQSSILHYLVEEACNEALALGPDAPDMVVPTRANRLAARARELRPQGPCHAALAAALASGVPRTLAMAFCSVVTGVPKDALTHPAQKGVARVIELLLAAGGDANLGEALPAAGAASPYESPLECAVAWGHSEAVGALLRGGARVTLRALASAGERGDDSAADALLTAAAARGVSALALLSGACTHPPAYAGKSPLMLACLSGAAHVVAVMLRHCPSAATLGAGGGAGLDDSPLLAKTPLACALLSGGAPELVGMRGAAGARAPVLRGSEWVAPDGSGMRVCLERLREARSWLVGRDGLAAAIGCDGCGALPGVGKPMWHACYARRSVRYCGEACQRAEWKGHKALCKELRKRPQPSA